MKTISQYIKCQFATNRYMIFSIPIVAIIFFLLGIITTDLGNYIFVDKSQLSSSMILGLRDIKHLSWSLILIIVAPFLHLMFIAGVFRKTYDFIIPINSGQKMISYIIIAALISIYNYLIILGLNYIVEFYFRQNYLEQVIQTIDENGMLNTEISKYSVFYTGSLALGYFKHLMVIFLIFPFFLYAILYFKKYSILISAGILTFAIVIGLYISTFFWEGYFTYIANQTYVSIYRWVPLLFATALGYIGLYYFLKEKEV